MRCTCVLLLAFGACLIPFEAQAAVRINEVVASNGVVFADEDGDFEDWIELYNTGEAPVNLEGWALSDDYSEPLMWLFPSVTIQPGGFLLVFASGKDRLAGPYLHTNFRIASSGEEVLLTRPNGVRADELTPREIPRNMSVGRQPDGTGDWFYFDEPTPGTTNDTAGFSRLLTPPAFSHESGFYDAAFDLVITTDKPGAVIRYTLDGSEPTQDSPLYDGPLHIASRVGDPNALSMIPTSPYWSAPEGEVFKATVVRAGAFADDAMPSAAGSHTYFVDPAIYERYDVPVVSVVADPDDLFSDETGIYVPGVHWEDERPDSPWRNPANYRMDGPEWERPAHITFFEPSGQTAFSQDGAVRIHGGMTASAPQKSLRVYARSGYGEDVFDYPLFLNDGPAVSRRFLMRNSGNDVFQTVFRDAMIQTLVQGLGLDQQAYRPAVVFINGEYWGIKNLRERVDQWYLHHRYGVDPDNLDILSGNRSVQHGDSAHYDAMLAFLASADISEEANYRHLQTLMDTDNFAAYQAVNIYVSNTDWPGNNIDYWRLRTDQYEPDAGPGRDGRWRWLVYDTDFGWGWNVFHSSPQYDTLAFATATDGPNWPNPPWSTFLLRTLLGNEGFRTDFINLLADCMNSIFRPDNAEAHILAMRDAIAPLMPEHMQRWPFPDGSQNLDIFGLTEGPWRWNEHVQTMVDFAHERPAYMRQHIVNHFGLPGTGEIVLDTDSARGRITINSLILDEASYPWTGVYFQGVPVEIEAIPAVPGYAFSHWEGLPEGAPARVTVELTGDLALTAHFKAFDLVHYWHFNDLPAEGSLDAVPADVSVPGHAVITYPGTGAGYMDAVDDGSALNARLDEEAGKALRVRNPSHTRALVVSLPTTGFQNVALRYAVRRTTNGATEQALEYRTEADGPWTVFGGSVEVTDDYMLVAWDFAGIEAANDNRDFAVRITFGGAAATGESGNNRLDNLVLDGAYFFEGYTREEIAQRLGGTVSELPVVGVGTLIACSGALAALAAALQWRKR